MDLRQRPPKPPVNNSDGSYRFHKDLTSSTPDDHRCRTTIAPPPKASDALPLPLYLTNAVFFSVAYYLLHRWRDKIRYNTPLHVVTITELGAIIALIASFIYLLGFFGIDFVQSFISRASGDAWDLADSTDADRNFIIDNDDHRLVTCSPPPPPITKLPNLEPIATESLPEEDEEVVKSVLDGVIPSYSLESRLGDCKREASIRREALQRVTGRSMEGLPLDGFDYESILRQCCEMLAGYVQIPVGIAGPFLLDGYEYSVPMATTEGCLVASTNRGCKAMYISGGATSTVLKDGMTRAPVVRFGEKWFRHYSSEHQILLVGEGDFSFSRCLALAFGSATNITATSLDSEEELCEKFKNAMDNVSLLKRYGCDIQHEVDVHMMSFDNSLSLRRYDRIVFNFPHAGSRFFGREFSSRAIESHQELVRGFLENAKEMLKEDGEIHITHKTTYPFSNWKIKTLAKGEGLKLFKKSKFKLSHYPGYMNKRGSGGRRSDQDFPVGQCSTLMFIQS